MVYCVRQPACGVCLASCSFIESALQENDDDDEGSDDDAAVDVLFNDDGSRNVPCRCAAACTGCARLPRSLTRSHRDEEELARERERKAKLTDKQMDEVLKTVPKVPPKPRQRGDFNSAM